MPAALNEPVFVGVQAVVGAVTGAVPPKEVINPPRCVSNAVRIRVT